MAMSKCRECGKAVSTLAKTCPSCGVPKPAQVLKKKTSTKKITSKLKSKSKLKELSNNDVWTHCENNRCKDFSQMYQIPNRAIGVRICATCKSHLKKARYKDGKPIMPDKGRDGRSVKLDKRFRSDGILPKKEMSRRQRESNARVEAYNRDAKRTQSESLSYNTTQTTSEEKDAFSKLMDGQLDLATAFWGFGVVGTMIVGFICGWLSEAYSKWWLIPYIIFVVMVIDGLWAVARNYKIEQVKKKQSEVWGFLVQAFCVMGGLGLFTLIKDTFFQFMRALAEGIANILESVGIPFELGTLIVCGGLLVLAIYLNYK